MLEVWWGGRLGGWRGSILGFVVVLVMTSAREWYLPLASDPGFDYSGVDVIYACVVGGGVLFYQLSFLKEPAGPELSSG
jgi:hypothetical protein